MTAWKEETGSIFAKGLDDPRRNIFFQEFADTGDERVWTSLLANVQVPGEGRAHAEEDDATFYSRLVGSGEIRRMLEAMETEADTDLLPFRVVHQVTEVVAGVANTLACEAAVRMLTSGSGGRELSPAASALTLGNRLLTIADESIKLMQRALTPAAYGKVRPNLGMVRGTSSVVLRKTLFNSTYPLLVRSCRLLLVEFSSTLAGDGGAVESKARAVLGEPAQPLAEVVRQLVALHQHVRIWRDNHIQLPKTHLGVSSSDQPPTVSLSGSDGAVGIAHELRKAHAADPITPLYTAMMGTPPPAVHELLAPGEFDEYMAQATAGEVMDVYRDVQERFYKRCPFRKT